MNIYTDWIHGTSSIITNWTLTGRNIQKGGAPLHKALFFTTSRSFAELSSGVPLSQTNVYQTNLKQDARVLDISDPGVTCTFDQSDDLRRRVVGLRPGLCNKQALKPKDWEKACRTGSIMKYFIGSEDVKMSMNMRIFQSSTNSVDCLKAWNEIQKVTRECIEDIVDASIATGYQAIAGNELQYSKTYPILIVLDTNVITPPVKV